MANKQFGCTLRDLRNAKGYTQQQVADLLGLKNKSTLGSWEVGKSEPDGYTLLRLCSIYEVDDIYEAFGEVSPRQHDSDRTQHIMDKYNLLSDQYKRFIENQIDQLLAMQEQSNNE